MENEPRTLTEIAETLSWPERIRKMMAQQHSRNLERRAAVLKHPDLAALLCRPPLGYSRPEQWNGFIPPATTGDEPDMLRLSTAMRDGVVQVRFNQLGKYTVGEAPNESPRRAALVAIATEAWNRERPADDARGVQPPAADLPDLLPGDDQQPALGAGAASPAGLHDAPGEMRSDHER